MRQVNEVNLAKWIVALRSGKYRQTRGVLRSGDGAMCCLGVACDISGAGEWVAISNNEASAYRVANDKRDSAMPEVVARAMQVESNPMLTPTISCIGANDDYKWSFDQIGAALESRYLPGKKAEEILEAVS